MLIGTPSTRTGRTTFDVQAKTLLLDITPEKFTISGKPTPPMLQLLEALKNGTPLALPEGDTNLAIYGGQCLIRVQDYRPASETRDAAVYPQIWLEGLPGGQEVALTLQANVRDTARVQKAMANGGKTVASGAASPPAGAPAAKAAEEIGS